MRSAWSCQRKAVGGSTVLCPGVKGGARSPVLTCVGQLHVVREVGTHVVVAQRPRKRVLLQLWCQDQALTLGVETQRCVVQQQATGASGARAVAIRRAGSATPRVGARPAVAG